MANDFNAAWLDGVKALDTLVAEFGPPGTLSATAQLAAGANAAALQQQLTQAQADLGTRTQERDQAVTLAGSRRTAIDGMIADLNAAGTADATEDAADVTGDAKRAAALAKGQGAP